MNNSPTELIETLTQQTLLALTEKFPEVDELISLIENQMQLWKGEDSLFFEVQSLHGLRNILMSDVPDIEEDINPYYPIIMKLMSDIDTWWDDFTAKNSPPYSFEKNAKNND